MVNGSWICVIAVTVPMRVKISCTFSAVRFRVRRIEFITPSDCKSTTQAVVRTRSEVHKGSSTISIITAAIPFGAMVST